MQTRLIMNREDVDLLVEQIKNILLNKPLTEELKSRSEELADLQDAIFYLSSCLTESDEFLNHLRMGDLDVKPPGRQNFLAGNLKELHSALKHLTWQANQVANGDYNQRVSFLGDFSTSFNQMIHQLVERESQLKLQSTVLKETLDLMKSIMDGLDEWIVVTSKENGEVIYTNQSAKRFFYDTDTEKHICGDHCQLLKHITEYQQKSVEDYVFEHKCSTRNETYHVRSYSIQWNEKLAYAHYITDVTSEKEYQEQIEELAYTDELTGLHNRRFCLENLNKLVENKSKFTFCMIDLDGLKFANDNYGHAAGDEYLKAVAREMVRITRKTDIICRIGGDEFAILFPNCSEEVVLNKMKGLDEAIMGLGKEFPTSVSYGVVHIKEGELISSETVMGQADEKMYVCKRGRSRL